MFFVALFVLSWWLMWKTFRINSAGNLEVTTKVWSDFAATIPLIRSFSLGQNFPPQYPLFSGPPIRYHFLFFFAVGMLEKIGIQLDWALNLLSTFSFFFLLLGIYFLSKEIFKKRSVSAIACLLFLFNGSLSFLEFFKKHPFSAKTFQDITGNNVFPSFAPYDGSKLITGFWNLNVYTNQRHLAFGYAFFLLILLSIYRAAKKPERLSPSKTIVLGILLGLFPFIHLPVFAMLEITLFILFILFVNLRKKILIIASISIIIALPQITYMGKSDLQSKFFNPGYLITDLNIISFVYYWFFNLGLVTVLAPIGFILAKKTQRKIFLPFLSFFVLGNLFQFSPEIAANHKFFNLFVIGSNMFAAYAIYRIWKRRVIGKFVAVFYLIFMTFSGIIDIFPIKNDVYVEILDGKNNDVEQFITKNTPKNSVFINASYIYDPASLAGRKILLGWPYFSWSAGYNTDERLKTLKDILQSSDMVYVCSLLKEAGVNYIETQNPSPIAEVEINSGFFEKNFKEIYFSKDMNIHIYDTALSCNKL